MSEWKATKATSELRQLIIGELRKYPQCNDVTDMAFIRPENRNWDVAYICDGNRSGQGEQFVGQFVRELQAQFDLQ